VHCLQNWRRCAISVSDLDTVFRKPVIAATGSRAEVNPNVAHCSRPKSIRVEVLWLRRIISVPLPAWSILQSLRRCCQDRIERGITTNHLIHMVACVRSPSWCLRGSQETSTSKQTYSGWGVQDSRAIRPRWGSFGQHNRATVNNHDRISHWPWMRGTNLRIDHSEDGTTAPIHIHKQLKIRLWPTLRLQDLRVTNYSRAFLRGISMEAKHSRKPRIQSSIFKNATRHRSIEHIIMFLLFAYRGIAYFRIWTYKYED